MAAKKTTPRKSTRPARSAAAKVETKAETKATAKSATAEVRKQLSEAIESARESRKERMLAGLGLISRMRKQGDERLAELVAEGKRVQPKVDKAIEELKQKLRPEFKTKKIDFSQVKTGLSKFKVDTSRFNRKAIEEKIEARMTDSLHRIGLPTRKEVQALARKVDKLAAAHAA